jgi:hypothetical protein
MRIISQGKEYDLPYEKTTIQAFGNGTVAAFSLTDLESDAFITMAEYSTKEKAIKAMEMCRKYYDSIFFEPNSEIFQFPAEEEVQEYGKLEPRYKHLHNCKTNQTALIRKLMEVQRNGRDRRGAYGRFAFRLY